MSNPSIFINERAGLVRLCGAITDELSLEFRETLALLVRYYQHRRVTLQIHSDGGLLTGLRQILEDISTHRANGVVFATEAPFTAHSAAAVLLASGEPGLRQVSRQTSLLFHHGRQQVPANTLITAVSALRLANMLTQLDAQLERTIVTHLTHGFGGIAALAKEGTARCQLLYRQADEVADQLGVADSQELRTDVEAVQHMWSDCSANLCDRAFQDYLRIAFARDTWMELSTAYSLMLIDSVDQVPMLLPAAAQDSGFQARARLVA